jgi:hypothetical protein
VRDRLLRDGFFVLAAAFVGLRLLAVQPWVESVDAYAYWATRAGDPYASAEAGRIGAYLYSPAFAQLLAPLVVLPWPVFCAAWTALLCVVYWKLVGRLALPLLLFIPIPFEIVSGNVHLLIAAAIVVGFRYPAAWALPLLTKVTPGIGLLWFALRRRWRDLAVAIGVTAAIAAVTFVLWPDRWFDWLALMTAGSPPPVPPFYLPFLPRFVAAVAIVVVAAWRGWRWPVVVAGTLALPAFYTISPSMLVGVLPFAREALGRWAQGRRKAAETLRAQGKPATDGILAV